MAFSVANSTPILPSLLSFPFHILLIATLLRYRKKTILNTPYFKILISISVHDILFFLFLILWNILAQGFNIIDAFPTLSATLRLAGGRGFYKGAQVALIAIALNRWINVRYPCQVKNLWTNAHTVLAIVLQYAAVVGTVLVHSTPEARFYFTNETTLVHAMPSKFRITDRATQMKLTKFFTLFNIFATGTVSLLYALSFHKLRAPNITDTTGGNLVERNNRPTQEMQLATQGVMLSLLMILHGLFSALKLSRIYDPPWLKIVLPTITTAHYYFGPLIAFAMSTELRKHAKLTLVGLSGQSFTLRRQPIANSNGRHETCL